MLKRQDVKPYMLVQVDAGDYRYIGQVMSFPFHSGDVPPVAQISGGLTADRVMVRRAPGNSTTLMELPLSKLVSIEPYNFKFVHYARVAGHGCFPTDMLRREWASPVNFAIIDGVDGGPHSILQERENVGEGLVIATTSHRRIPMWNAERWMSFGWLLKEIKTLEITEEV